MTGDGLAALRIILQAMLCGALLLLVSCTTATIDMADGTHVSFTRFATDAAIELGPETLSYSSNPSAIAQQNANILLTEALKAALGAAVPVPRLRGHPQARGPFLNGSIDELSCPETGV